MSAREPLTEDAIIEKLSGWIARKGLTVPAILFLESHRHMNFVASQFLVFFQPMLTVLFDQGGTDTVIAMMEKRENVERLLVRIEQKDQETRMKQEAEKASRRIARGMRRVERQSAALARRTARKAERERT